MKRSGSGTKFFLTVIMGHSRPLSDLTFPNLKKKVTTAEKFASAYLPSNI